MDISDIDNNMERRLAKLKRRRPKVPSEHDVQASIVAWVRREHPGWVVFSVPNEACFSRADQFRETGMLPGASDLVVVTPKEVVFCEVKSQLGRQRRDQRTFEAKVEGMGYRYLLVRSLDDFVDDILGVG